MILKDIPYPISMTFSSRSKLIVLALCVSLAGAGCGGDKSPSSSSPAGQTPTNNDLTNAGASVPDDVLVYPQGTIIASTGYGESHTVAQLVNVSTDTLLNWIKTEYPKKNLVLKNTSIEGGSTTFIYENTDRRYTVRVDRPLDNQGSALTVIRDRIQ